MKLFFQIAFFLCNVILGLLFVALYPLIYLLLYRKRYLQAILQPAPLTTGGFLIHAASVGEVNAIKPLINELIKLYPEKSFTITTNTLTGLKTAKQIDTRISCSIAPLDFLHLRINQMKNLMPDLLIIVETEIWLNQLFAAGMFDIPVIFVNARLSTRSLNRYKLVKPLLNWLEIPIRSICVQSQEHRKRFRRLFGCPILDCGNLKYAVKLPQYEKDVVRTELHYAKDDFILCFGSSRPQEEELIINIYDELKSNIKNLKLIIAIRHLNRVDEVVKLLGEKIYSLQSKYDPPEDIHIIDTYGLLNQAYSICDIAIVGGSFYDFGGHNPLEPAFYGKPIIIGEYNRSCVDSVQKLNERNAIIVSDVHSLKQDILSLYENKGICTEMGKRARAVLSENANSLEKHIKAIVSLMGSDCA